MASQAKARLLTIAMPKPKSCSWCVYPMVLVGCKKTIKGSFCVPVPFRAVGVPVCAFSAACGARAKG